MLLAQYISELGGTPCLTTDFYCNTIADQDIPPHHTIVLVPLIHSVFCTISSEYLLTFLKVGLTGISYQRK